MENIGVLFIRYRGSANEVTEFSRRMANAAEVTVTSAQEVEQVCRTGGSSVNGLMRKAEDTEASFRFAARKVNSLQESVSSVRSILNIFRMKYAS